MFHAGGVEGSVFFQDTEDEAVGTVGHELFGIGEHRGVFGIRVGETGASGADHADDGQGHASLGFDQRADGRGETADGDGSAEFDAIRASGMGFQAVINGTTNDLDGDLRHSPILDSEAKELRGLA